MLAYHCDSNAILIEPFQSRHDRDRIAAHGHIMTRLCDHDHLVEHQILDNEVSKDTATPSPTTGKPPTS